METHFSGAQRPDGRRRRRIAAESDGPANSDGIGTTTSDGNQTSLGDVAGSRGASGGKSGRWQRHGAIPLVPRALWKHFAYAFLILAIGSGLLAGAAAMFRTTAGLPAGFARLFSPETGTLHRVFPGLLLFLAGQTALVIRWYRSRSLHDYNGRYRLWTKVAIAWFLLSASVATDAHLAWSDTCRLLMPWKFWRAETLVWLAPISLVALVGWLPLYREMQGSRLSIGFFLVSSSLYLVSASLRLECVSLATPELNWIVLHGLTWLGHLCLLLSMTLHVRHVIHFTIEPVESRTSRGRRKDGGRLDWIKPSRWFRRAAAEAVAEESSDEGAAKKGRSRRKPIRAKSASRSEALQAEVEVTGPAGSEADAWKSSEFARSEKVVADQPPLVKGISSGSTVPRVEISPAPIQPARPIAPPQAPMARVQSEASAKVSIPRPGTPAPAVAAHVAGSSVSEDEPDGDVDAADGVTEQRDLRGLSKKQRRKMLREIQEREQQARRR